MTDLNQHVLERLQATIAEQKRSIDALQEMIVALTAQEDSLHTSETAAQEHAISPHREHEQNGIDTSGDAAQRLMLAMTMANLSYDSLLVLDGEQRIMAINRTAEALFGVANPVGERVGLVTNSAEIENIIEEALSYREEYFEEQLSIGKRMYRVRTQVIEHEGKPMVGLALQDVTELVRLNRARRDMVANISHELRTPIANIRLIIDSLFHGEDKPRRKESRSALKAIAQETDSLLWLVQELLDLSMIESGQAILRMVDVPARLLVDEAVERMADQMEAKNLKVASVVPDNVYVLCDRDQVRRVLINLIHNAIKWSPAGEKISVEVRDGDDEVTFAVLDNGPGVPDAHTDRIFERFYQVDASRSGGEGTGLGLAICKHIVEAHGGRIWAEGNGSGGGGRFLFTLPRAEAMA
jgi:two-component system, OmpR family, phosphate regulon sensor histidine kinase PhoR